MNAPVHHEGVDPSMLAPPPAAPWRCWQESLAGRPQPFKGLAPQFGFWRYRPRMAERGAPAAIWHDDGAWVALVDGRPVADVAHVWRFGAKFPISQETYEAVLAGGLWPDEQPATEGTPEAGHNTATPEELALDAVRQADEAFRALLKEWGGAVSNEEQDAAAKGYDDRIAKLRKDAEKARKDEKDAYLRGGQAIDAKWAPIKAAAAAAEDFISDAVTAYRKERKRLADVAAAEERAERDRVRAAASAQAAAAVAQGEAPPPAPIVMTPRTPKAATGLRKVETAVLDDPGALAAFLVEQKDEDLLNLLRTKALRMLKSRARTPGARLVEEYKA